MTWDLMSGDTFLHLYLFFQNIEVQDTNYFLGRIACRYVHSMACLSPVCVLDT